MVEWTRPSGGRRRGTCRPAPGDSVTVSDAPALAQPDRRVGGRPCSRASPAPRGTLEERDAQIARSGFYGEYPAILTAYVALFTDAAAGLEALKRAVFLAWYAGSAPPSVSAIRELPEHAVRTTVASWSAGCSAAAATTSCAGCSRGTTATGRGCSTCTAPGPRSQISWRVSRWTRGAPRASRRRRSMNRGQLGQYWRSMLDGRRLPTAPA